MPDFKLKADFKPAGDQPKAIACLTEGLLEKSYKYQTLLGVTGSGKTFTIANVIEKARRPVLVVTHNKTLAAQLYNEFRAFFPNNAVEYFVSYYDYYQPEAYIPQTDTYIAKDASINEKIDRLRLSATRSLLSREDVIVVASVSCIYGLGSPQEYKEMSVYVYRGQKLSRSDLAGKLVDIQYSRNDIERKRGQFRMRGGTIEVYLSYEETVVQIGLSGNIVENIAVIDSATGEAKYSLENIMIFPSKHFIMPEDTTKKAVESIRLELKERLAALTKEGKLLEAERLEQRTNYDLELLSEIGYCPGIENYSRHFDGRKAGEPPSTLLDFFKSSAGPAGKNEGGGFLTIIDESHATIPQIRGMYEGDYMRKKALVDFGFRLPSAFDNRPLKFGEFEARIKNAIFVSATPSRFESEKSAAVAEQIIRPTGLAEPEIIIKPCKNQVKDLVAEAEAEAKRGSRALVTTLTKKQAEELTGYLVLAGIKAQYLHSDIDTLERVKIIRDLRLGKFDCFVGVNLLREGLDIPEVALVAILDADKEGFLRNTTSLIQTMGRAARNSNGKAILYADTMTESLKSAVEEVKRRRKIQLDYNKKHGIAPKTITKEIAPDIVKEEKLKEIPVSEIPKEEIAFIISELESEMNAASERLEFEKAAEIRDRIIELKKEQFRKAKGAE